MPTTGIQAKDGKDDAVVIPSGAILTVPTGLTVAVSGTTGLTRSSLGPAPPTGFSLFRGHFAEAPRLQYVA
jgi:hypothetical protein